MKKNRLIKVTSTLIAMTFLLSSFAGCSTKKGNDADKNEVKSSSPQPAALKPVKLRFYFPGDKLPATDEVWTAIAEKYKEKLNATFDVNFIGLGDYKDKMILMAASGDNWDMNYDGPWQAYTQMISRNAYMDLSTLLPKYAPDLYATYQKKDILSAVTSKKMVLGLPWTQTGNFRPWVLWRKDMAEKAKIDIKTDSIKTIQDLEKLLYAFKAAYPNQTILALGKSNLNQGFHTNLLKDGYMNADFYTLFYNINDPKQTLVPIETTDTFLQSAKLIRKWVDDGIVSKDDLVDKTSDTDRFTSGQVLVRIRNSEEALAVTNFKDPSFTKDYSTLYPEKKYFNRVPTGNMMCINKNAANPERTLMFMNLLETDKALYDMVIYGLEGKTYVLDGEATKLPAGMTKANYMDWSGQWAFWKPNFMRPSPINPKDFWLKQGEYATISTNINNPLGGLQYDTTEIKNEVARRNQIFEEYGKPLMYGLVKQEEIEKKVAEYIAKQKEAGIDKILSVAQKQVEEYLASMKK